MEIAMHMDSAEWLADLDQTYEDGLEHGLEEFTRTIELTVIERTPYDHWSEEGAAKSADEHIKAQWDIEVKADPLEAIISNPSEYGPDLEEGLYPGVGPRTAPGPGGGIYSKQAPAGIVGPIISDRNLISKQLELVKRELDGQLDQVLARR